MAAPINHAATTASRMLRMSTCSQSALISGARYRCVLNTSCARLATQYRYQYQRTFSSSSSNNNKPSSSSAIFQNLGMFAVAGGLGYGAITLFNSKLGLGLASHPTTMQVPSETSTHSTTTKNTFGQRNRSDSPRQEESCQSCLYTGVGTCVGLSGYFLYLALEEDRSEVSTKNLQESRQKQHKNNTHGTASSSQQYNSRTNGCGIRTNNNIPKKQPVTSGTNHIPTSFQSSLMKFMQSNPAQKKNRPFLFAFSAVWAVAGAYRLYLN